MRTRLQSNIILSIKRSLMSVFDKGHIELRKGAIKRSETVLSFLSRVVLSRPHVISIDGVRRRKSFSQDKIIKS